MIHNHNSKYQRYVDDVQLCCHFDLDAFPLAIVVGLIERCIDDMNEWMKWNYLLVNDTITTCLPVVPKSATTIANRLRVLVGPYDVVLAERIRTLSVHLSIPLNVSRTISTYSLHIRIIGLIRPLLYPTDSGTWAIRHCNNPFGLQQCPDVRYRKE